MLLAALLLALAPGGRAEEPAAPPAAEPGPPHDLTLRPGTGDRPRRLRAAAETGLYLGAQFTSYLLRPSPTAARAHRYSPLDKLLHGAASLDANSLATNFAGHPIMGAVLHQAARANRLPAWEAALWSAAGSALWELAEYSEAASLNDLLVTPVAGVAIGEPLFQLAAHLDRSPEGRLSRLAWLLSPWARLHDALDGSRPARGDPGDALAFRLAAGGGAAAGPGWRRGQLLLAARWELVADPVYGAAGQGWRGLLDGQVSGMGLGLAASADRLDELRFHSGTLLAAVHVRDRAPGGGADLLAGAGVGFDARLHAWTRRGTSDAMLLAQAPRLALLARARRGPLWLAAGAEAALSLGGARSFALDGGAALPEAALPTVQRGYGYHFGLGPSLSASLEAGAGGLGVRLEARLDELRPLDRPDPTPGAGPFARLEERWTEGSVGLAWRGAGLELSCSAALRERRGRAGDAVRSVRETGLGCSAALAGGLLPP